MHRQRRGDVAQRREVCSEIAMGLKLFRAHHYTAASAVKKCLGLLLLCKQDRTVRCSKVNNGRAKEEEEEDDDHCALVATLCNFLQLVRRN